MANILGNKTVGTSRIIEVDGDPRDGTTAPQGTIAIYNSPGAAPLVHTVFAKVGSLSDAWVPMTGVKAAEGDLGALTWTATTDPSGTITKKYRYIENGDMVNLWFAISASTAGTGVTQLSFPLPSPDYGLFTGFTATEPQQVGQCAVGIGADPDESKNGLVETLEISTVKSIKCEFESIDLANLKGFISYFK